MAYYKMFLNKFGNILKCFYVLTNLLNHAVSLFAACIKVCLLMGDNSNLLSRAMYVALFLSFSRLVKNCTHTHTHSPSELLHN